MDNAKAISKYVRISPRKARLAAALIRGLPVADATAQLLHCELKAGRLIKKTLDSAVANAEANLDLRRENLRVTECRVDEGPRLKRSKPKNRGGRHQILKRTSHLIVSVGVVE
jgi:large subunit ribosomal protein L22